MYIIKVRGKKKIPDYVQIRDDDLLVISVINRAGHLHVLINLAWRGRKKNLSHLLSDYHLANYKNLKYKYDIFIRFHHPCFGSFDFPG